MLAEGERQTGQLAFLKCSVLIEPELAAIILRSMASTPPEECRGHSQHVGGLGDS